MEGMTTVKEYTAERDEERLDRFLAAACPEASRSRWQERIGAGAVRVGGVVALKNTHPVKAGEVVRVEIPDAREPEGLVPMEGELSVIYEDADILVLDKPAGLVVHPAPGHDQDTLVNLLLHACGDLGGIGDVKRPGIVHRLDRDTSGVMAVAKSEAGFKGLSEQFAGRETRKEYVALCWGVFVRPSGVEEGRIGRDPRNRKKMAVVNGGAGRAAVSRWNVERQGKDAALVRVRIETGRTHQIRVHMAAAGHPVCGDAVYGRRRRAEWTPARQMLHAERLELKHPVTGEALSFRAPWPEDFKEAAARLAGWRGEGDGGGGGEGAEVRHG